jgi:anti-sigma regulatory factor (Ser/Thr protein kinase)
MVAGLCVEEMAGNVIQHGFLPGEEHSVGVRVVVRDKLTIRVRDDCRAFDPQKRLKQFHPEEPWKNVGIRMIARMAEEMNYQRSTGINTLLIKV